MNAEEFENLVKEAVLDLPENIRSRIDNLAIVVYDKPTLEQLRKTGVRKNSVLLGLYEGVPGTAWGKGFGNYLPDKITIFQNSIEMFAKTPQDIKKMAKGVVLHEIAHYFGMDEAGARRIEKKKKE
jgi:predicted Zn-dependent protease with MMP-like domain